MSAQAKSPEVGALGIRKDAKNMFNKGTSASRWKRANFKLRAIKELGGNVASMMEGPGEEEGEEEEEKKEEKEKKKEKEPAARPAGASGLAARSKGGFGQSRSNLFDSSSVVPSACEQMGSRDENTPVAEAAKKSPSKGTTPVSYKRQMSTGQFGMSRSNLFDQSTVVPSAAEQHGHIEGAQASGSTCSDGSARESAGPKKGTTPVGMKRQMSTGQFGMSRSNLFDVTSVVPSAAEQHGHIESVAAPLKAQPDAAKNIVNVNKGAQPKGFTRQMSTGQFGMSRSNLFDVTSVVPSAAEQHGHIEAQAAPVEARAQSQPQPVGAGNIVNVNKGAQPKGFTRQMSTGQFGMSRSNLFDITSVVPSAAEQHGHIQAQAQAPSAAATAPATSTPSSTPASTSVLASTSTPTSTSESTSVSTPAPLILERNMSKSHFGMSRANLFDASTVVASASDQMGQVGGDSGGNPGAEAERTLTTTASDETFVDASRFGAIDRSNTVSMLLALGEGTSDGDALGQDVDSMDEDVDAAQRRGGEVADADADADADASGARKGRERGPVLLEREMSTARFSMSRANLFDAGSIVASAADHMGGAGTGTGAVAEGMAWHAPAAAAAAATGVAVARQESVSQMLLDFNPGAALADGEDEFGAPEPSSAMPGAASGFGRQESVSQMLLDFNPGAAADDAGHEFGAPAAADADDVLMLAHGGSGCDGGGGDDDEDDFGAPAATSNEDLRDDSLDDFGDLDGFGGLDKKGNDDVDDGGVVGGGGVAVRRQESLSQMLLDFSPGQPSSAATPSQNSKGRGIGKRQESLSQMMLDFVPAGKPRQSGLDGVSDDGSSDGFSVLVLDDDHMDDLGDDLGDDFGRPAPGVKRQESLSHMLLDFSPGPGRGRGAGADADADADADDGDEDFAMFDFDADAEDDEEFGGIVPGTASGTIGRQESLSQMLLDFSPPSQSQPEPAGEKPTRGPPPALAARQESVSQMLLTFEPKGGDASGLRGGGLDGDSDDEDDFGVGVDVSVDADVGSDEAKESTSAAAVTLTSTAAPSTAAPSAAAVSTAAPATGPAPEARPAKTVVMVQREMSQSAFGASRSNLFDQQSLIASASQQMGFSAGDPAFQQRLGKPAPTQPISQTNTVSITLALGDETRAEEDIGCHDMPSSPGIVPLEPAPSQKAAKPTRKPASLPAISGASTNTSVSTSATTSTSTGSGGGSGKVTATSVAEPVSHTQPRRPSGTKDQPLPRPPSKASPSPSDGRSPRAQRPVRAVGTPNPN